VTPAALRLAVFGMVMIAWILLPPGNCTVSVDSGSIDDSLVCICQAQTKKGKDTFKVVECGNPDEEDDCDRRQGEVKRYIDADPNSSQGLTLDCTEKNCNDFCPK